MIVLKFFALVRANSLDKSGNLKHGERESGDLTREERSLEIKYALLTAGYTGYKHQTISCNRSQQDNFINPKVGLNNDKENLPCPVPFSAPALPRSCDEGLAALPVALYKPNLLKLPPGILVKLAGRGCQLGLAES